MSDIDNSSNSGENPDEKNVNPEKPRFFTEDMGISYRINHDTFFKLTFAMPEVAIAFLKNALPPDMLDKIVLEKIEIRNGELGESDYFKKSAADLIYVIPCKEGDEKLHVFAILEHKSYSDRLTMFQLAKYCFHVMERELEQAKKDEQKMSDFRFSSIIPIIIHHGESAFYEPTELSDLINPTFSSNKYGINAKAILFDLNQICVDDLQFGMNVPEFVSVLKMMQAIFSRRGAIEASEALTVLRPYSNNPKYQSLIYTLLVYLLQCSKHVSKQEYSQIVHDDNVINREGVKMPSLLDQFIAEGEERGIEKGIEQGIEQGKELGIELGVIQTLKESILSILSVRFGSVPQNIQDTVNARYDKVALQTLQQSAVLAKSLDDFAKEI